MSKKQETKRPVGRPVRYTEEVQQAILSRVAEGMALHKVAQEVGVNFTAVLDYARRHEDFREALSRAREVRLELLTEELFEMSERAHEMAGDPEYTSAQVQSLRNAWEQKYKLLSVYMTQLFGNKQQVEVTSKLQALSPQAAQEAFRMAVEADNRARLAAPGAECGGTVVTE